MGYYLRRPNGSKYDLSGDQYDWYLRCEQLVAALGRQRIIMQPDIVQLIQDYGKKDGGKCVYDAINYSRGLGHWSVDAIEKMLKGEIPIERAAPARGQQKFDQAAPQSHRTGGGPRNVQEFLGDQAPKRKTQTPDGKFKLAEVEAWLKKRDIPLRQADEYFRYWGRDTAQNDLWILLPEHTTHEQNNTATEGN